MMNSDLPSHCRPSFPIVEGSTDPISNSLGVMFGSPVVVT